MPTTEVFACPASLYVSRTARRHLYRLLVPALLVAVALAVGACFDSRYAYVLLMVLLVVYPMVLAFAWIALTGKESMVLVTRPQRWSLGSSPDEALTVEFFRFGCDPLDPGEPVEKVTVAVSDIERSERRGGYHSIWTRSPRVPLLLIPQSALEPLLPNN